MKRGSIFSGLGFLLFVPLILIPFYGAHAKSPRTIEELVSSNLKFVASEQIDETGRVYWAGEWPTKIYSTLVPVMVGVGRLIGHDQEATAFTTANVINQLASLYFDHPDFHGHPAFRRIPEMIRRGIPTFERYREGDLYNFYPPRMWKGVRVHQPVDMNLMRIWKGFTNIPQDADTSSSVYAAKLYDAKMKGESFKIPESALQKFSKFRDEERKAHFYNRSEKRFRTGAYMTWLSDENSPFMPRFYFAGPDKGVRIPFSRNDVDCIVNLNVLRMLALDESQDIEGRKSSCQYINDVVRKNQHASCGIYYPNTYHLAFAIAETRKVGEGCFQPKRLHETVEFILKNQSADGGWNNVDNTWQDRVQSTAFAMTALLDYGDLRDGRIQSSLKFGTRYLLRSLKTAKNGTHYWSGEVFFTATAIARSLVVWKSNSYTTLVAANALLKMARHFPDFQPNVAEEMKYRAEPAPDIYSPN